jgi:type IV pilus assembly protein PilA
MTKTVNAQREDDGFTLVELMIVIAIISLLAAIALPLLRGQRQKAFQAMMSQDLHSVVTAQVAYATANDSAYTTDLAALGIEGYRASNLVDAHVKVVGAGFVACTKHDSYTGGWLVYSSATGTTTSSGSDCV